MTYSTTLKNYQAITRSGNNITFVLVDHKIDGFALVELPTEDVAETINARGDLAKFRIIKKELLTIKVTNSYFVHFSITKPLLGLGEEILNQITRL